MPTTKLLRLGSALFGIVAALFELYIGLVVAFAGVSAPFKVLLVVTMPFVVLWGAIGATRFREADIAGGVMLLGFSLQHCLVEIKSLAQIPLALILVAAGLAYAAATIEREQQTATAAKS
jgi:hypothetical protein